MKWSHHGPGRAGYHHGNLKEALIQAALGLIAANGPLGFTFAEAARQAGVSPAAPYRHFRDREQLLADVAARGFDRFAEVLTQAWNGGAPEPVAAFIRLGKAYLAFARTEPGYYAAMFQAGVPLGSSPELQTASDRAFGILRGAAETLAARLPPDRRPPALMMALHVWAMSHGVASLFAQRAEPSRTLPMSPEDLLEAGVLVYLQGLGLTAV